MSEPIIDPDFPPEDPVPPEPEPVPGEEQPVVDGWTDAPVSGDRVNVFDAPIVAGDPGGARIEIRSTGFHAFNGVGTETAHIDGSEGVFVGGSFRTSDTLPGQVTLSDDALSTSLNVATGPGIRITPEDTSGFEYMPGIGPSTSGLMIYGGKRVGTGASIVQANPTESFMRTFRGDGAMAGEIQTSPTASYLRTYQADGTTIGGSIQTTASNAFLQTYGLPGEGRAVMEAAPEAVHMRVVTPAGLNSARISADGNSITLFSATGGQRYLKLNDTGIWIEVGGKAYNLEETAQDSGWQSITLASGLSGSWSPAWRNKGGVIYLRGRVTKTGNWTAGWNVLVSDVGPAARPASHIQRAGATRGVGGTFLEVTTGGVLQVWFDNDTPGTTTVEMSPMFYPLG